MSPNSRLQLVPAVALLTLSAACGSPGAVSRSEIAPGAGRPEAPVAVEAAPAPLRAGALDVRWQRGPGPAPTRYVLIASPGGANISTTFTDEQLIGLIPGEEYRVVVFAINDTGWSPPSEQSAAVRSTVVPGEPVHLPTPPPPDAIPSDRCEAHQVQIGFKTTRPTGDNATEGLFEIRNASDSACYLQGFVTVEMLDRDGTVLFPGSSAPTSGEVQIPVALAPGTDPITPGAEPDGHAYFWMEWTGRGECLHAVARPEALRLALPVNATDLQVPAASLDGSRITACDGLLGIGVIRPDP